MEVKVFSKDKCMFCTRAKLLLKSKGIPYSERKINVQDQDDVQKATQELGVESFKTVPQILIDGQCIGGYEDLKQHLEQNNY